MAHGILIRSNGGPDVLEWAEIDLPDPGPGEVRVRHTAIGVNFIDIYFRTGLYKVPPPVALGSEAALELSSMPLDIANGRALFERHCASCHGPYGDGEGVLGDILELENLDLRGKADPAIAQAIAAKIGMWSGIVTLLLAATAEIMPSLNVLLDYQNQNIFTAPLVILGILDVVLALTVGERRVHLAGLDADQVVP